MALLVLNTSVILKWFLDEEYSDITLKIRDDFYAELHEIVEPDLLIYEFTNVLRYNPKYMEKDIKRAVNSLLDIDFDIVLPTLEMINKAVALAKKYEVTVYDAIFVSLAELVGGIFITADEKLYEKIKELEFVKFIAEFEPQEQENGQK